MQPALFPREITPDTVLAALLLRVGPANGASATELASEVLGRDATASDERTLRSAIGKLCDEGHPICGVPEEGYHIAANAADLDRTCIHNLKRAMTTLRRVAAMRRKAVPDVYGQLGIELPQGETP